MDTPTFNTLISFLREAGEIIHQVESLYTPAELSTKYLVENSENTSDIWRSIFMLSDEMKMLLELYDNSESGFFLSLSAEKTEEIYKTLINLYNSYLIVLERLQAAAPNKMTNEHFSMIEESLGYASRLKQFLIENNLYTG